MVSSEIDKAQTITIYQIPKSLSCALFFVIMLNYPTPNALKTASSAL